MHKNIQASRKQKTKKVDRRQAVMNKLPYSIRKSESDMTDFAVK